KKSDAKKPSISSSAGLAPPSTRPATQQVTAQASASSSQQLPKSERIELLPPESDFRTSLILPDLSRRFSLLRQPDGRPVDLQDVREMFAAQRVNGSPNVISEEEEEYVIKYLSNAGHIPGGVVDDRGTDDSQQRSPISTKTTYTTGKPESIRSTATPNSAFESSFQTSNGPPSTRSRTSHTSNSSRRYSNNLFGSGRLKDQQYMRGASRSFSNRSVKSVDKKEDADKTRAQPLENSQTHRHAKGGQEEKVEAQTVGRNGIATAIEEDNYPSGDGDNGVQIGQAITSGYDGAYDQPSDLDLDDASDADSRPVTPVQNGGLNMQHDLPPVLPLSPKSPKSPSGSTREAVSPFASPSASPYGTARKKGPVPLLFSAAQVRRASLALEEVIRNFEQDSNAEEEILTPRTPNGNFQANGYTRTAHPWSRQQPVSGVSESCITRVQRAHLVEFRVAVSPRVWSRQSKSSTEREGDGAPATSASKLSSGQLPSAQDSPSPAASTFQADPQSPSQRSQHSPLSALARSASARHAGGSPLEGSRGHGRLPGYIPGMHRPITPKDVDSEEATTPRALSPSASTFGYPTTPKSGGSSRGFSEYSHGPHRRFGSLASGTFGPSSPLSPASPRSATQGTATPILKPPVSAWSSTTASPTSPIASAGFNGDLSSAALRAIANIEDSSYGRQTGLDGLRGQGGLAPGPRRIDRDTKMSTSSSSILPPSTSSSSLTSLYQSDSGTTMLTSPDFGTSFQGAGPSSPGVGAETSSRYPPKPVSPIVSALRSPNTGAIMASSPSAPMHSSDSRPDTPLGQIFHSLDGDALALDIERGVLSKDAGLSASPVEESTESDHEDLLNCWGGITRKDLTAIHDKLVDAAIARKSARSPSTTPSRARSPSASSFQPFATRSPSRGHQRQGSQYSARSLTKEPEVSPRLYPKDNTTLTDTLQKTQVAAVPPSPTWSTRKDKSNKVNALLQSMVDSLPPPTQPASFIPSPTNFGPDTPVEAQHPDFPRSAGGQDDADKPPHSANSRRSPVPSFNDPDLRKKALTEALFGESPSPEATTPQEEPHPYTTGNLTLEDLGPVEKPSVPVSPAPQPTAEELIAEVSRRNAAATEALKSPGITRSESALKRQGTKRVDVKLISGPQPIPSPASVDAASLATSPSSLSLVNPASPSPVPGEKLSSKLSLRIKKLRDKLKTRPSIPNGDEVTPYNIDARPVSPVTSTAGHTTASHTVVHVTQT
ncbi:hypothetical protein FRC00_006985, partial [Tulasnella sp. 408]